MPWRASLVPVQRFRSHCPKSHIASLMDKLGGPSVLDPPSLSDPLCSVASLSSYAGSMPPFDHLSPRDSRLGAPLRIACRPPRPLPPTLGIFNIRVIFCVFFNAIVENFKIDFLVVSPFEF